jgi:hypothetical protein
MTRNGRSTCELTIALLGRWPQCGIHIKPRAVIGSGIRWSQWTETAPLSLLSKTREPASYESGDRFRASRCSQLAGACLCSRRVDSLFPEPGLLLNRSLCETSDRRSNRRVQLGQCHRRVTTGTMALQATPFDRLATNWAGKGERRRFHYFFS